MRTARGLAALLLCLLPLLGGMPFRAGQEERRVLAFYYPWYGLDIWADPVLSDRPAQPYYGAEPEAIARHVQWASYAGIDVLVSAWFGSIDENPTEVAFRHLLDAAAGSTVRAALLLETDSPEFFPSLAFQHAALAHALATHATHPAYFTHQDKPVIFVWRPRGIWLDGQRANRDGPASVEAWRSLRNAVDPDGAAWWIAEGEYPDYLAVFDGLVPYNVSGVSDPAAYLARLGNAVRGFSGRSGVPKLWVATAMPGYDDTRLVDRRDRYAVDRQDGEYYRLTFAGAAAADPDWISISSFNEWVEGHQIEPSVSYGNRYLDLTRELTTQWKSGR